MKKRILKVMSVMLVAATLVTGAGFNEVVNVKADTVYDENGYDADGYDKDGYTRDGYDADGYDKDGYTRDGYDKDGYDREGYNYWGYDKNGYNRNGYDKDGYDKDGYDQSGIGKDGYDREGYDKYGCDKDGYRRDGYNLDGYDRDGYDRAGYDKDGYDHKGYDWAGYKRDGYNDAGYDKNGYDREGYNKNGYAKDGYNKDGYDKNGYDRDGYDKKGYDKKHRDKNGNLNPKYFKKPNFRDDFARIVNSWDFIVTDGWNGSNGSKYKYYTVVDRNNIGGKAVIKKINDKIKKNSNEYDFKASIKTIAVNKVGYGKYKLVLKYGKEYGNVTKEKEFTVFPLFTTWENCTAASKYKDRVNTAVEGTKEAFKNVDGLELKVYIITKKAGQKMKLYKTLNMSPKYDKRRDGTLKSHHSYASAGYILMPKKWYFSTATVRPYVIVNGKKIYGTMLINV